MMADTPNTNGSTNKLLLAVLCALLGIGGLEGVGTLRGDPAAEAASRDLEDVHEVVTRTDGNGVPLVYVPRELVEGQRTIVEELRAIKDALRDQDR
jgi:hypothetical protein